MLVRLHAPHIKQCRRVPVFACMQQAVGPEYSSAPRRDNNVAEAPAERLESSQPQAGPTRSGPTSALPQPIMPTTAASYGEILLPGACMHMPAVLHCDAAERLCMHDAPAPKLCTACLLGLPVLKD